MYTIYLVSIPFGITLTNNIFHFLVGDNRVASRNLRPYGYFMLIAESFYFFHKMFTILRVTLPVHFL